MIRRMIVTVRKSLIALSLTLTMPAYSNPADGNGKKFVGDLGFYGESLECGAETDDLVFDAIGWLQGRDFSQDGNRNAVLTVFHLTVTYLNVATGATWVWRDRGPDREYYVANEDGQPKLRLAITGRAGFWNIVGHAVLNLDTGEFVFNGGRSPFDGEAGTINANEFACGVLNNGA